MKSVDDTAAKAVPGVRQIVRLDDAVAVVADHMGAAKKGLAALDIEWDDGPHAKLDTTEIAGDLERLRSIRDRLRRTSAISTRPLRARHQGRGDLRGSVPRARDYGTDELHRSCPRGRLRRLGRHAGRGARPGGRGKNRRPAAGQGRGPQSSDRRRLRPAVGKRWRRPRGPDRTAGRRPGQSRLDPRGRHPARHVPALFLRPAVCRPRREGKAGRLEPSLRGVVGYRAMAPSGVQQWSRPRHHRRRDRSGLCPPERACRVCAGGTAGHSDRLLAQRRAVAQRLRDRKLHGRAGGRGEARSGRLSPGSARQVAPRQSRPRTCRGKGRLGTALA